MVCSILRRKNNIKKNMGPKKKSVRLIKRNVNKMIEYNEKVTARKVISIFNLKVSRRTMQRELHDNDYVYGNITTGICLSKVDKISSVEICKTWLKTRVDFAKVMMTDSFSYHGKGKMKQKRLLRHSSCLLYTSPSPRD